MLNTLTGVSDYIRDRMDRMQTLVAERRTANPAQLAAVDEAMDRLCQDLAAELEKLRDGTPKASASSKRLQRMLAFTLEELIDLRDKARQERRVDS